MSWDSSCDLRPGSDPAPPPTPVPDLIPAPSPTLPPPPLPSFRDPNIGQLFWGLKSKCFSFFTGNKGIPPPPHTHTHTLNPFCHKYSTFSVISSRKKLSLIRCTFSTFHQRHQFSQSDRNSTKKSARARACPISPQLAAGMRTCVRAHPRHVSFMIHRFLLQQLIDLFLALN